MGIETLGLICIASGIALAAKSFCCHYRSMQVMQHIMHHHSSSHSQVPHK